MNSSMATAVSPFINASLASSSNVSEEERQRYIDQLKEEWIRVRIPAIIFLATIATVGLFGNSMVLLVYSRKVHRKATDVFILTIASFDLLTNCVSIPGEIYVFYSTWDFDNPIMCKLQVFFNTWTIVTSAIILLAVAISRYRMVCRPFGNQTSLKTAKIASISIALFGLLCATPQIILCGSHTIITPRYNITVHDCTTDLYYGSLGSLVYYAFQPLFYFGVCIPLVVLYVLISIQAWRHSGRHGIPVRANVPATSNDTGNETGNSEDSHRRLATFSRTFKLFKNNNQKYNISSGNSINEVSLESDVVLEMRNTEKDGKWNNSSGKDKESDDETSPTEVDDYSTRKVCSPSTDTTKAIFPMLQNLPREIEEVNYENEDSTDAKQSENTSIENEKKETSIQKHFAIDKNTERYLENLKRDYLYQDNSYLVNEAQSYYPKSLELVDITYCLQDENKSDDESDSSNSSDSHKKKRPPKKESREENLRRRLTDTPIRSRAMKAKKESRTEADENKDVGLNTMSTNHDGATKFAAPNQVSRGADITTLNFSEPKLKDKSKEVKIQPKRKVLTRTTFMMIIISAVFVVAFVPHLTLKACRHTTSNFLENMSPAEYTIYDVFLRFYFLNSATNAIIYGLCDARFRKQMLKIICICKK